MVLFISRFLLVQIDEYCVFKHARTVCNQKKKHARTVCA